MVSLSYFSLVMKLKDFVFHFREYRTFRINFDTTFGNKVIKSYSAKNTYEISEQVLPFQKPTFLPFLSAFWQILRNFNKKDIGENYVSTLNTYC